jgi:hypothetical protein
MKTRKDGASPYFTNKAVKSRIDKILAQNQVIQASLGTNSSADLQTREAADAAWGELALKIKELDEHFFNIICPYGVKE